MKLLDWNEITSLYRRRPARFKAIQYESNMIGLPDGILEAEYGDWFVYDIESEKTYVLKDDVFGLVFESVD